MIAALKGLLINVLKAGGYLINVIVVGGSWLFKKFIWVIAGFFSFIIGLFIIKKGKEN